MNYSLKKSIPFILIIQLIVVCSSCYELLPPPVVPDVIGNPPQIPNLLFPEDNAYTVGNDIELEWFSEDSDDDYLTYDIYFGTQNNPPLYEEDLYYKSYLIDNLSKNTKYYWKIVVHDEFNDVEGPIWSFSTSIIGEEMYGGIVFYVDDTGEHGLICAPVDFEEGYITSFDWGFQGNYNAYGDGIGEGMQNTTNIVNAYTGTDWIAADLCYYLYHEGYSDWYLPSKTELLYMYENLKLNEIGNFSYSDYWSSTEYDNEKAYSINFYYGSIQKENKEYGNYVRAIRQF